MREFSIVHNIPSPYRLHLFQVLDQRLQHRAVKLHVHFMARTHVDRPHWKPLPTEIPFEHTFWRDLGPSIAGYQWHFNPGLARFLLRTRTDYLLVGGLWDSLTTPIVSLTAKRGVAIGWFEGNTHAVGRVSGAIGEAKKALCSQYDFLAVPGSEGEKYANIFLEGKTGPEVVTLPNIVDEKRFRPGFTVPPEIRNRVREQLGLQPSDRVALWPARLVPVKGVLEFVSALNSDILSGWRIVLLGEGPLEEPVRALIRAMGMESQILLRPYISYERMPAAYAAADLFMLPSLYDPNPLSVVEAMHSGLPILVSTLLGNYPEACSVGRNGWSFDPRDKEAVVQAASRAFATSSDRLREMGRESAQIAKEFWGSTKSIDRFLDVVLRR